MNDKSKHNYDIETAKLKEEFNEPFLNVVIDTIKRGKQALIFVNTKQRAEKTAEMIAKRTGLNKDNSNKVLNDISNDVLKALSKPTKQCERLSRVVKQGIAFHHSGLVSKQRKIIEDNFKSGVIKIICCTPTLAYGLNLPAFRVIVRDLKRYGYRGYSWIPVLEIQQMFGRAGRPEYDREGQAVCIAKTEDEENNIIKNYLLGRPEDIYSKLAVEPVFRTYLLSLISIRIVRTRSDIIDFFEKTFWAYQFKDSRRIKDMINRTLLMLKNWGFVKEIKDKRSNNRTSEEEDNALKDDFVSAGDINNEQRTGGNREFVATRIGQRVAELYLDPLTAHHLIEGLTTGMAKINKTMGKNRATNSKDIFPIIELCTNTLELRPYLRVRISEYEDVEGELANFEDEILNEIPKPYDEEYDDFLNSFKTSLLFFEWANEKDEEYLLEKYSTRPGELHSKLKILDWLIHASHELALLKGYKEELSLINKTRLRIKYGVKEELLPLLKLKNIGRVRARKMYRNNLKTIGDIKKTDYKTLSIIIGEKTALSVKEQLNQVINKTRKRIEKRIQEDKKKGDKQKTL